MKTFGFLTLPLAAALTFTPVQASASEADLAGGTILGAVAGAIIGHQNGHREEGALIGAALGLGLGALSSRSDDYESSRVVYSDNRSYYSPRHTSEVVVVERERCEHRHYGSCDHHRTYYRPQTKVIVINPRPVVVVRSDRHRYDKHHQRHGHHRDHRYCD